MGFLNDRTKDERMHLIILIDGKGLPSVVKALLAPAPANGQHHERRQVLASTSTMRTVYLGKKVRR